MSAPSFSSSPTDPPVASAGSPSKPSLDSLSANRLSGHYADYFATPEQLEWYALMAVDKSDNIMSICRDVPHDSILDVGAGDGAVLNRLDRLDFGTRLCAVDISESGLRALKSKAWKHLEEGRPFDGYAIPYPDQSFDLVVLSHVIEHVEHPRILLREAARVGRHVYIEVPLEFNRTNRRLKGDFKIDATGHINFYNPALIRLLIQSSGLNVLRQEVRHFTPKAYTRGRGRKGMLNYWIKETALRLNRGFASTWFNYHCGILCKRESV